MKQILVLIFSFFMMLGVAFANANSQANGDKVGFVSVSIAPQAYFVEQISGGKVGVNVLLPANANEHNFEFKPSNMKSLEKSDIYFTIDLEFEKVFLDKFKQNYPKLKIVNTQDKIMFLEDTFAHDHDHEEDEHHDHSKDAHHEHEEEHHEHHHAEHKIVPAVFDDNQVKDRELSDWEGEFKNVYPYLLDKSLDGVFELKAKHEGKSAKEIKEYYDIGYKSDIESIKITKDTITFKNKNETLSSKYAYKGFKIFTYESGKKGVRYQFESIDKNTKAPKFIQFSDHQIDPTKVNHFHIYMGNESFDALSLEMKHWPTFYKNNMSKEDIVEDMTAHLNIKTDPHTWLDPILAKQIAMNIEEGLSEVYPQNKDEFKANLNKFLAKLDELDKSIKTELSSVSKREFIVYHPSWGYFAKRYNLAQIPLEIDGKEPKPRDLQRLIKLAKDKNIKAIFVQPGFSENAAKSLAKESGAKIEQINHISFDYENELLKTAKVLKEALK